MWDGLYIEWISFVIVMALGQFSPGPDMILLTRVALSDGYKSGCATATGIATGLTIHAGVAIFFVDLLTSQASQPILLVIYLLAVIYLLWLAWGLLSSAFIEIYSGVKLDWSTTIKSEKTLNLFDHYRRGLLCNLLNPKVAIFLAGVVLPFQQLASNSTPWSIILWLTIVLEGLILWCLWVKLLQNPKIQRWYSQKFYIIDGIFGIALIALTILIIREII